VELIAPTHVQCVYAAQVHEGGVRDLFAISHVQRVYAAQMHEGGVRNRGADRTNSCAVCVCRADARRRRP
jgi:hypothetical protein